MKKILLVVLAVVMGGGSAFAAGSSRIIATYVGLSNTVQTTTAILAGQTIVVNTRGTNVYNITCNATSANGECDLYDTAAGPTSQETPVYEVKVATSGDSRSVDMSGAPLQTVNGLTVTTTNATAYINGQY